MTEVLEDAIEKVRKLPEDRQAYVPDDHRAAVLEGLGQADRGEFATDEEMAALWKKCGL
jgi:predicted transcriptional regulator